MQTLNRTLRVVPNHGLRTFTIYCRYTDKSKTRYRTNKMSKEQFNSCLSNTQNDWVHFLKSDDYYIVKN